MTESEFEIGLRADGYDDVEKQTLEPRPGKGRHRHHFAIRGLVLSGKFIVAQLAEPVTYSAGDLFQVAHGELHDEWVGEEGATVLVGRRHAL